MLATFRILFIFATDVPPNFITIRLIDLKYYLFNFGIIIIQLKTRNLMKSNKKIKNIIFLINYPKNGGMKKENLGFFIK